MATDDFYDRHILHIGVPRAIQSVADKWSGCECSLDGKPARIIGRLNGFATIAVIDLSTQVEFAWPAVDRIMKKGGAFFSS